MGFASLYPSYAALRGRTYTSIRLLLKRILQDVITHNKT
jgi:hypothetical protein